MRVDSKDKITHVTLLEGSEHNGVSLILERNKLVFLINGVCYAEACYRGGIQILPASLCEPRRSARATPASLNSCNADNMNLV